MQSIRRKDLVYTDTSKIILEHDEDIDAESVDVDNKTVYKGLIDSRYSEFGLDVQWLYNDESERVGLIEYETLDRNTYSVLWYYDNPFGTFLQEPGWTTQGKTVWSLLSNEAYQDCLEDDFESFVDMTLGGSMRIVTASMLSTIEPHYYECEQCGKKTLSATSSCSSLKKVLFSNSSILFLDDSYVIYAPPSDSRITRLLQLGDGHEAQEVAVPVA
jgi:hypothetical protein